MVVNRVLRRIVPVAAVVGLAMVAVPGSASAAASSSVWVNTGSPKTRAAEALFNRQDAAHANKAWFVVNDTKCDANDVYVEYAINGGSTTTKYNSGGCGTSKSYNLQSGHFAISFRVCVDDAGFNTCSEWRGDNN
jgi:hypothetical protein